MTHNSYMARLVLDNQKVLFLPAELVCGRFATTTQKLCAHLSICCAIHLPAEAAVHSTQECRTTFADLDPVATQECDRSGYSIHAHGQSCKEVNGGDCFTAMVLTQEM